MTDADRFERKALAEDSKIDQKQDEERNLLAEKKERILVLKLYCEKHGTDLVPCLDPVDVEVGMTWPGLYLRNMIGAHLQWGVSLDEFECPIGIEDSVAYCNPHWTLTPNVVAG